MVNTDGGDIVMAALLETQFVVVEKAAAAESKRSESRRAEKRAVTGALARRRDTDGHVCTDTLLHKIVEQAHIGFSLKT